MICLESVRKRQTKRLVINNFIELLRRENIDYSLSEDISKKSYIKIGTTVKTVSPKSSDELVFVLRVLTEKRISYKVVGKLTNLLICDSYTGFLVKTDKINTYSVAENKIILGCGLRFTELTKLFYQNSLGGFEELSGIPGSIGGMIYSNAGAFGKDFSSLFLEGRFYNTDTDTVITVSKSEMEFSYRSSILKSKPLIALSAILELEKCDKQRIIQRVAEFKDQRMKTQPFKDRSLGSVFKRPDGYFAGELIDKAGLKGYRVGGAQVSMIHAGFIVNAGGATSDDFINLCAHIKKCVFERFGVLLKEEIEILT